MAKPSDIPVAAEWLKETDRLLIVAAAGLSIHDSLPNNPYHSARDFAHQYPELLEYGYRNAYECMGIAGDENVPMAIRKGFTARHFLNMRENFPPTDGYKWLLEMAKQLPKENVFCWTSNVDGCFERSGFDPAQVYTSQGDMKRLQCGGECGHTWVATEQLKAMEANSRGLALQDMSLVPTCPNCGSRYMPNLRGGDWFIHKPYEAISKRLMAWLDDAVANKAKVTIVEVGVGRNTPIVSKIPAGYFASAVGLNGGDVKYIRINPDSIHGREKQPPIGVDESNFKYFQTGWQILGSILEEFHSGSLKRKSKLPASVQLKSEEDEQNHPSLFKVPEVKELTERYKEILYSLWTPRHNRE